MPQLTPEQQQALQEKLKKMSPEELLEFQRQQCIFCQIIAGKIPAKTVFEDDSSMAIVDINPATRGHLLLFPKEHVSIMPQLPDAQLSRLFSTAQKLSQLLLRALRVEGTTVFIANGLAAGQRSQHFLLHLIPRKEGDGLFAATERSLTTEEKTAAKSLIESKLLPLLGATKKIPQVILPGIPKAPKKEAPSPGSPKKPQKREKKDEQKPTEGKVSLDDIANLFK